jgi:hypothetical protein
MGAQPFDVLHVSSLPWFSGFLPARRKELKKHEEEDLTAKNARSAEKPEGRQLPNPSLRSLRSLRLNSPFDPILRSVRFSSPAMKFSEQMLLCE